VSWEVLRGDCVELMQGMEPCSVDAVVCDPPYGLEFMGKEWDAIGTGPLGNRSGDKPEMITRTGFTDGAQRLKRPVLNQSRGAQCLNCGKWKGGKTGDLSCRCDTPNFVNRSRGPEQQAWHQAWATEALRVLKPGGHLLAFGGTRTYHRLACAVEDAGFEIRDTIAWMYGQGFPKSLNVGCTCGNGPAVSEHEPLCPGCGKPAAGLGTALKPAHEPIVCARKPLSGTVAQTVLEHGCGALNIDATRIGKAEGDRTEYGLENGAAADIGYHGLDGRTPYDGTGGRWPANVVLDEEAAGLLDEQTGELTSGALLPGHVQGQGRHTHEGGYVGGGVIGRAYGGDSGGASRFFFTVEAGGQDSLRFRYVAKASRAERNAGLDGFEERFSPTMGNGIGAKEHDPDTATRKMNVHPTVKPISLMRWLVRLVTPPGGTVLDPFAGSGTTGCAAVLEGFDFVGCEREPEYADIAEARIAWWTKHRGDGEAAEILAAGEARDAVEATGQESLFNVPDPPQVDRAGREGEASADRRYTDKGGSNFAMKPGKRRAA
jgi:DNA modification methylase